MFHSGFGLATKIVGVALALNQEALNCMINDASRPLAVAEIASSRQH